MFTLAVLIIAGLMAGGLNAIAGGGIFLSFPALVWLGVPPITANATATLAAVPGYVGSAWAHRHDIAAEGALGLRAIILTAALGGLLGAGLLLVTPYAAFAGIAPWLFLVATCLFAAGPRPLAAARSRGRGATGRVTSAAVLFFVSAYGGYFHGGLGILLLAVLGLIGFTNIHGMNGNKNLLSAIVSVVAVAIYTAAGLIAWDSALILAGATMTGGYFGARWARRIQRTEMLRAGIAAIGSIVTVMFFIVFYFT